uniref:HTH myb-type domain-containing protein n=1 Tax=Compsopogon caeruleus TaxID=31354 RepID=A0A7S1T4I5_9RHOD|mmetsp:Transcript_10274/g.20716  ORF Transcript_10274/g.20716 Transcript_10274/m.20716 type:complete len:208 (+) Transcript_10274:56-679(+)
MAEEDGTSRPFRRMGNAAFSIMEEQKERISFLEKQLEQSRSEICKLRQFVETAQKSIEDNGGCSSGRTTSKAQTPSEPTGRKRRKPDDSRQEGTTRYWSKEEHDRFLKGVGLFGPKNFVEIAALVGTRTPQQVRTHSQKYEIRLMRKQGTSTEQSASSQQMKLSSDDLNGFDPTCDADDLMLDSTLTDPREAEKEDSWTSDLAFTDV